LNHILSLKLKIWFKKYVFTLCFKNVVKVEN
jgi:hypothetical protein